MAAVADPGYRGSPAHPCDAGAVSVAASVETARFWEQAQAYDRASPAIAHLTTNFWIDLSGEIPDKMGKFSPIIGKLSDATMQLSPILGNKSRALLLINRSQMQARQAKEQITMKITTLGALSVLSALTIFAFVPTGPVSAASASLTALDPDNDGTVDLAEAHAAAAKLFKKLDPDNDGTLDAKELSGRIDAAGLKKADPDNDGTLDQKEFDAVVAERFHAANPDNDGTLDEKELASDAGKSFLLLVE